MKLVKILTYVFSVLFVMGCEEDKLDIEKFGTITGVILDSESYDPLQGVQVATSPASSSALTGDDGAFSFGKVAEGEIAVTANKADYLTNSVSVAVYDDENTDITFYLEKDDDDVGWVEFYDPVPGNGAVDQSISFTFQWSVDQEHASKELCYTVYIYTSNSTVQNVVGESLDDTEVVVSGLSYETAYYWYVVAKHEGERVANSPTWTFKTEEAE